MLVEIALDIGVNRGVGAFEVGVGDDAGRAMAGANHQHHAGVVVADDSVEMEVDEIEARSRAEVAEQARFNVVARQRTPEERVFLEIDLTHREIVCGAPVRVHELEFLLRKGGGGRFGDRHEHLLRCWAARAFCC